MSECKWEEIHGFQGQWEFEQFELWVAEQVATNVAEETDVKQRYAGSTIFAERWFRHKSTGATWRLVDPEPPFAGVFEPVQQFEAKARGDI